MLEIKSLNNDKATKDLVVQLDKKCKHEYVELKDYNLFKDKYNMFTEVSLKK